MRKKLGGIALLLAALLCLSGCGGDTKETILEKVSQNIRSVQSYEVDIEAPLAGKISVLGMTMEMAIDYRVTCQYEVSGEETLSRIGVEMDMEMLGESDSESVEFYCRQTPETTWLYTGMDGEWYCEETPRTELDDAMVDAFMEFIYGDPEAWILYGDTVEKNGVRCYALVRNFTGEDWEALWQSVIPEEVREELEADMDLSELTALLGLGADIRIPCTLYVDSREYLPVSIRVDMGSALNHAMNALADFVLAAFVDGVSFDMDFDLSCVTTGNASYNTGVTVEIPPEALEAEVIPEDEAFSLWDLPLVGEDEEEDDWWGWDEYAEDPGDDWWYEEQDEIYAQITAEGGCELSSEYSEDRLYVSWPEGYVCTYYNTDYVSVYDETRDFVVDIILYEKSLYGEDEMIQYVEELEEWYGYADTVSPADEDRELRELACPSGTFRYRDSVYQYDGYDYYVYLGYLEFDDCYLQITLDCYGDEPQPEELEEILAAVRRTNVREV